MLLEGNKRSSLSFQPFHQIKKHRHFLAIATITSLFALGMLTLILGTFPYSNIVAYSCFGLAGGTSGACILLTVILALHKKRKLAPNMNEDAFVAHPFMQALFKNKDPKALFTKRDEYVAIQSTEMPFNAVEGYGRLKNGWFLSFPKDESGSYLLFATKQKTVWYWYVSDGISDKPLITFLDHQIPPNLDQNETFIHLNELISVLS